MILYSVVSPYQIFLGSQNEAKDIIYNKDVFFSTNPYDYIEKNALNVKLFNDPWRNL